MIYNATDIWTQPSQEAVTDIRDRIAGSGRWILLLIGGVQWRKGADIAVRALSLLPQVPLHLVLVGEDNGLRGELMKLAAGLGVGDRLTFTGYLDQPGLADVLRAADCVLGQVGKKLSDWWMLKHYRLGGW